MSRSKSIVLELLREGPPHNQLLSPLTRYLAVCENRPPESVRLSVEHRDFLRWQAGLTYSAVAGPPCAADGFAEYFQRGKTECHRQRESGCHEDPGLNPCADRGARKRAVRVAAHPYDRGCLRAGRTTV